MTLEPVAYFHGPVGSKFGLPRQSGLVASLEGRIEFVPAYRDVNALRGLEGFDRIWLIWGFSANRPAHGEWQPTVRPPRLGGNVSMGVWATRSPFRPNPLGLSAVRLIRIETGGEKGPVLYVGGADMMDGTPIYDIKPYLVYADSFPESRQGFVSGAPEPDLEVAFAVETPFSEEDKKTLTELLALDPRPAYAENPDKTYGLLFGGFDVRFQVVNRLLTVTEIVSYD